MHKIDKKKSSINCSGLSAILQKLVIIAIRERSMCKPSLNRSIKEVRDIKIRILTCEFLIIKDLITQFCLKLRLITWVSHFWSIANEKVVDSSE